MNTLTVPGATLHYEVDGSGPVLLLICGGVYDAAGYAALARQLSDRYTVVRYDRRGNSRSPLDGPPEPQSIEVHGDDAHRVLSAVGVTAAAPAHVFGNSSGGMIGLELAGRHPEQVRTVVVHEPPLFELLPDRDHWRAVMRDVEETFYKEGPEAAGQILNESLQMSGGEPTAGAEPTAGGEPEEGARRIPGGGTASEPDPETMAMMARLGGNMEFFIGYEVPPFSRYVPDLDTLRASDVRVLPAVGVASNGEPPYQAAVALGERLGTPAADFPGDHGGFGSHPEEFAARLHESLQAN